MTNTRNIATIDAIPLTRDRARVRQLLPALVLALAVVLGVAATIGVTTPQPIEVAPSYQGDWKDTFIVPDDVAARTHSGDWKDHFLPEVAGR